ncbi:MAG: hypothetical protein AB7L71_20390 [Vicinamibacterales bacterium]
MYKSIGRRFGVPLGLLALLSACEHTKTSNPLSPLIAGPIEGVSITQPILLEPEQGRKFKPAQLPLSLLIENPSSNSPRPFTLRIELSSSETFAEQVVAQTGVAPGSGGRTTFALPASLPVGRRYYWRVKAEDGANASEYSAVRQFEVLEPVVIGTPSAVSPVSGVRTSSRRPDLVVSNAAVSGPYLPLTYIFQVATDTTFSNLVVFEERSPGAGQTILAIPHDLAYNTPHYWRARVTDSEVLGNWSATADFVTPMPPSAPGGGGGPVLPPGNCASSDGPTIVACIEAKYPQYLVAGISLHERENNMAFLRDRVIEAGICGGLDLAWNLKRGVGPHSIDALAWRIGNVVEVVDIGAAFDDTSQPLRLQWGIVAGPPGYDGYSPRPTCG